MTGKKSNVKDVNLVDISIGIKINQLRLALGKTRQELAAQIGVTHQQLQKYEKGINRITASRLVTISKALDVTASYFLENSSYILKPEQIKRQRMCVEIMRDFISIKREDQQEAVRRLIRVLSNPK